jgi:acetylornithine deacetylase/succinyl-diaminopimelate desuccinylase-like protein
MAVANEYELSKMDKAHEQATELQNSRLTVQENIAENRLKLDTINSALNQARADKELQIQQQRLDLAQETEARIKSLEEQKLALDTRKVDLEAAASSLDRFGTSVDGRIMNIITGKGVFQPNETAAMLAERYGRGETTAEEDITLNQAIEYFVAPKPVWDADNRRYTLTEGNKLAQEWRQAIEKRQGVEGKTVPTLGDSPKVGSGTSPADNVIKGLTATKGDLPRFDATGQPIDIKDTTYQSIIAGLDPTLATGSPTAFKQVLNRTVETLLPIFNQPFPETSRAADMLNNLNTLTTVIQMQALPGKEGEQLRAELKNVLPEPAAWTKGDQTAYNKIKNTIANLNASLVVLYSGGASASEAGKIERNIVALNTIKDAYAQLGRGYELKMGGGTGDQKMFEGLFR